MPEMELTRDDWIATAGTNIARLGPRFDQVKCFAHSKEDRTSLICGEERSLALARAMYEILMEG
jgi:hypothetical protein